MRRIHLPAEGRTLVIEDALDSFEVFEEKG